MSKFKAGDKVWLKAMPENDIFLPEIATVIEDEGDGIYFVEVEEAFLQDEFDDGYREVDEDQIKEYK